MSTKIYQIIDEGFQDSVSEQLMKHFGNTGEMPIYFRSTKQPEIMLASTESITDEIYINWCKENEEQGKL